MRRMLLAMMLGIACLGFSFGPGEVISGVIIKVDNDTIVAGFAKPISADSRGLEMKLAQAVRKVGLALRADAIRIADPCEVQRKALAMQVALRVIRATRSTPCEPGPKAGLCYLQVPPLVCYGAP